MDLYLNVARFNHSCRPNVRFTRWQKDPAHPQKHNIVATRPIKIGDEMCYSYIDHDQIYRERQQDLWHRCFICECDRCLTEEKLLKHVDREWLAGFRVRHADMVCRHREAGAAGDGGGAGNHSV